MQLVAYLRCRKLPAGVHATSQLRDVDNAAREHEDNPHHDK